MERTFMACLSPFHQRKCIFHVTNDETMALFASLTTEIKNLQISLANNSLTLQWCIEAMTLLQKLHSEFLLIILEKLKVPFTWNCAFNNLLNLYMNESLNIMELCNMLKSSSCKINMYRLRVDITIKNLNNYGREAFANMESIQRENKRIHDEICQEMKRDCSNNILYAIRVAISLLYFILVSVFLYPTSMVEVDKILCNSPGIYKSFRDSVNGLVTDFQRKYYRDGERWKIGFYEYEEMEKAIMQTKAKLKRGHVEDKEEIKRNKEVILQKSAALQAGLEKFESQANQVFEEVLKGRNQLLHMIGKGNGI
ncbi:hypothetical protein A4A49_12692 [Nicotiana attenuata]|uniref:Uncharacterized protein n=1 Tax=Nicotiana attenuata TaxID=49451 RepID=A0A314L6H0_NICAT|nr:hypothetical protein A4A49_12692 [Nicotiana attenuata]